MGFMIECPNLLFMGGKLSGLHHPQGLSHEIHSYSNIYPNTYVISQHLILKMSFRPTHIKMKMKDLTFTRRIVSVMEMTNRQQSVGLGCLKSAIQLTKKDGHTA